MTVDKKYFTDALTDKGLSMRVAATKLGMKHHSQLSLTMSGDRRMQLDEAIGLARLLGKSLDEVIAKAGYPDVLKRGKRVSVVGVLRGNGKIEDVPANTERTTAPDGLPEGVVAIQARTLESPLQWMDRWVFFCGHKAPAVEDVIGQFCYLKVSRGGLVMGTLRHGYERGTFGISGPYTAEAAKIDWAMPVLMTRN